jgi:predicted metal-binding membrane protein
MMTAVWDIRHLTLLWAMWAVMMVGMMLPSASPMLLLYGGVARRSATVASAATRQIYALSAGYLVVWASFSLGATALQRLLAMSLFVSPMMRVTSPVVGAVLLLIAGVYQLTPIKLACHGLASHRLISDGLRPGCPVRSVWVSSTAPLRGLLLG